MTQISQRLWSPLVAQLDPYVPGEQPQVEGLIKLNTNESPYPPSPKVGEALTPEQIDRLRLYPDPGASALRQTIATYHGVRPEQVFVGNGSDEVLAHAFCAFFRRSLPLLLPDISYSFYPVYCNLYGIRFETVPLAEDFSLDLTAFARPNGGIAFANPNAPTGMGLPLPPIRRLLTSCPDSVVLVDEAYVDFGGESAVPLVAEFDNLLVVQTVSKSRALAGLRVGYAIGDAGLIEALDRVKNSFNSYPLDRLAQVAVQASIADEDYFQKVRAAVMASRDFTSTELTHLGFQVLPSQANFVFARHPAAAARHLFDALRQRKILVRHFDKPRISEFLRISIGAQHEMETLIAALREILATR